MTPDKVEEMVADGGAIYNATVPDKKQLLLRVYDLYEAGKKQDHGAYFRLRTEVLELIYEIQRTTLTAYGDARYEEGVKAERERIRKKLVMSEVEKERHKTVCPRRAGSGMCECGKYYRGLSVHLASVRNHVIAFSEKGKLWHDKEHPKETAKVHETYFNK